MDINQISNKTILRILGLITLFVGVIWLAFLLQRQLMWVVISIFFTLALNPLVEILSRYMPRKSRGLASAIVVFGSFVVIVVMVASFIPMVVNQSNTFLQDLPKNVQEISNSNTLPGRILERYDVEGYVINNQDRLVGSVGNLSQPVLNGLRNAFSGLVAVLTVISLTYFMLAEGADWIAKLAKSRYGGYFRDNEKVFTDMYRSVSGYVAGNLATSALAAVAASIMLTILGVPYAIPLGILVGIFDLLPLIGATLAAIIVTLFTLLQSVPSAIIMLIFFLIYQQIENQFLQPMVYAKTVQISPLVVFLAALFGASLAGLVGALIAIPIAASAKIMISYYFQTTKPKTAK